MRSIFRPNRAWKRRPNNNNKYQQEEEEDRTADNADTAADTVSTAAPTNTTPPTDLLDDSVPATLFDSSGINYQDPETGGPLIDMSDNTTTTGDASSGGGSSGDDDRGWLRMGNNTNNNNNNAAQGPVVTADIPTDATPPRPTTPVAGNGNNSNNNRMNNPPLSPSNILPMLPMLPPNPNPTNNDMTIEDETIINSELAEAWFERRRAQRMQQMLTYNPPPPPLTHSLSTTTNNTTTPMMDPRTGGFQHGPSLTITTHASQYQTQQQVMYHHHQAHPQCPVDVDSVFLEQPLSSSSSTITPPTPAPIAQATMVQGTEPPNNNSSSSSAPASSSSIPSTPHFIMPPPSAFDNSDSMTVISKPNSLSSYISATTSDMTPVVSNIAFPGRYNNNTASMGSSYAASSSSLAYYPSSNYPRHHNQQQQHHHQGGRRPYPQDPVPHQQPKGFCAAVFCGGGTGDNNGTDEDRNSCKGFLDVRTYHGKLAIMLVTILILAIATMVVSATMTFQTNKSAKAGGVVTSDDPSGNGRTPTLSPVPTTSPVSLSELPSSPSTDPPLAATVPMPMAPTVPVSRSPMDEESGQPSFVPTVGPTVEGQTKPPTLPPVPTPPTPAPTESPTRSPTPEPTQSPSQSAQPTTAPTTKAPVTPGSPTPRPTDSLDEFVLPIVATIPGPDVGSYFGSAVALSRNGEVLAVGAPEHLGRRGQVHIYFAMGEGQWESKAILNGTNAFDTFGFDVAVSNDGNILAVGASGDNGTVHTYVYNPGEETYSPIDTIRGLNRAASFGHSVALSEDGFRLVVGAPYTTTSNGILNGQVRVYELAGRVWKQLGDDLDGESSVDWLGSAVDISLDGQIVIASAPRNRSKRGYVRTWTWVDNNWRQTGEDITNNIQPAFSSDRFGHSIALSESKDGKPRVAIGSPWKTVKAKRDAGMALVYEFDNDKWRQMGEPITQSPSALSMENGNAVDLDGGLLSVGIPGLNNVGAVALYRYVDQGESDGVLLGSWEGRSELIVGSKPGDNFGVSLASRRDPITDGFALLVGALMSGNNGNGSVTSFVKREFR